EVGCVPCREHIRMPIYERGQIEVREFDRGRLAGPIARDQLVVCALEFGAVEAALFDQELDPGLVAVEREQRMVEVEQCQYVAAHERSDRMRECRASGSLLRPRSRASPIGSVARSPRQRSLTSRSPSQIMSPAG